VLARKISLALFQELSQELEGYQFQAVGCLNLFDPASWPERATLLPLYDQLAAPYEILDAAEMRRRWPELTPDETLIGLFDPLGGYSEPDEYLPGLVQKNRSLGVELREQQQVIGFIERSGRIVGVTTAVGPLEADAVICTVHIWTMKLFERLGWPLPLKAFVHQRYLTTSLPAPTGIPAINANPQGGYIRPARGQRLLAGVETAERPEYPVSSLEFNMSALSTPATAKERLKQNLTPLITSLGQTTWAEEKVGLISFSMDGEPILGPVGPFPGLYLGCAFHSGGFAYNPVAGLLLAELVTEAKPSVDLSAFSPDRFEPNDTADYLAATVTQAQAVRRRH
jgi:glycine/D-amino acid oxidase-like deaminating enzyme